ncbi:sigma-54-dependent Fis family transcriptional regulator [Azohydromonas lata]|uniref:Sigma-54-dependent Fis family transcriptional regulator n=1 Tax=Azohydromonas lata TaxID=45677 RepID=A0ABU5IKV8_9BURK|nr:sigma-54-dependent Fis family transcriptional regulator [Azohydromonas lata]MDZ5459519.1 sigma-54-dependent Fis family transcriptional regulator [Azohydromonas lata]
MSPQDRTQAWLPFQALSVDDVMKAWERFLAGEVLVTSVISTALLNSWQRSLKSGVDPVSRAAPLAVRGDRLQRLRERNHELLEAARGLFDSVSQVLSESGSIMLLTDADGIVLEAAGNLGTLEAGQEIRLVEGGNWHEDAVGTNGIGTALATAAPAYVHAAEHFCEGIKSWSCAAAPIRAPVSNKIIGVVDISGPPNTFLVNNLTLAMTAAQQIERVLAEGAMRDRLQLLEVCLKRVSASDAAGMIALDRFGRLVHAAGQLPTRGIRIGEPLPGLDASGEVEAWAERLPAGFRADLFQPVVADGKAIGALVIVPQRPVRSSSPMEMKSEADSQRNSFAYLAGRSPALQAAMDRARQLAARRVTVLIEGETGTGKELFARALHGRESENGPFITFNCGAATKELIAGELFGHVRGAYTGATSEGRAGRFELAHGGTLCLDEIGELPAELQPVLLRVLEEGVLYRLGDTRPRRVDVRLLAMTHRDLRAEVEAGRFRRDLYHRIAVTRLKIPPLRERGNDVDLLIEHFSQQLAERHGVPKRHFPPDVLDALRAYAWPGNVRELRNVVESLLLVGDAVNVSCEELDEEIVAERAPSRPVATAPATPAAPEPASLEAAERLTITRAIQSVQGNLAQAARHLGISRSTLYRKVERYGLESIVRHADEA